MLEAAISIHICILELTFFFPGSGVVQQKEVPVHSAGRCYSDSVLDTEFHASGPQDAKEEEHHHQPLLQGHHVHHFTKGELWVGIYRDKHCCHYDYGTEEIKTVSTC